MKRAAIFLGLVIAGLVLPPGATGQSTKISGLVRDYETKTPLPGANIFLNQTTIGRAADSLGSFTLDDLPAGTYRLVVSMVGYEKYTEQFTFPLEKPLDLNIFLKPKVQELGKVVVVDKRPKQWLRDLRKFKDYFLGKTKNATQTTLLNPEVMEFSKESDTFVASSLKPLEIRNEAMGYHITFHLDRFLLKDQIVRISGHSAFELLEPESENQQKRWMEERQRAYQGSFRHFIHSLVDGDIANEGFRLFYATNRVIQPEKAMELQAVEYPDRIYRHTMEIGIIELFNDRSFPYLRVEYLREPVETRIARRKRISERNNQISWIEFTGDKAKIDIRSAHELAPLQTIHHGYWGWTSRIPDLLPAGYQP